MTQPSRSTLLVRILGASLVAFAGLTIAGAASAQIDDLDGVRSVRVETADLNLGSRGGAREMLARIDDAARRVCGDNVDLRSLERRAQFQRCKTGTVARAVRALDAPLVTAMAGPNGSDPVVLSQR